MVTLVLQVCLGRTAAALQPRQLYSGAETTENPLPNRFNRLTCTHCVFQVVTYPPRTRIVSLPLQNLMTLKHGGNPRCLDMDADKEEVFVTSCDSRKKSQKWNWERADEKRLRRWDEDPWP